MGITTHILDTARGRPAEGVEVDLEVRRESGWRAVGRGATDADGRVRHLLFEGEAVVEGTYRITFQTGSYFRGQGVEGFFPEVAIVFDVRDANQHHHVPLLLSPFGYSTYRGS